MKRALVVVAAVGTILLGGCAGGGVGPDRVVVASGPDYYDGYYDGFYGPFYDGYWGDDSFYYYQDHDRNWYRDDDHHFRRDAAPRYSHIHGSGIARSQAIMPRRPVAR